MYSSGVYTRYGTTHCMVAELELMLTILTRVGCIGAPSPIESTHSLNVHAVYQNLITIPLTMALPVLIIKMFSPPGTDMLTSHVYT